MAQDDSASVRTGQRRRWAAALAGLVPVVPIVAGIVLTSGTPARSSISAALSPAAAPQTTTKTPASGVSPRPARLAGALVAWVRHATAMRAAPGGPVIAGQRLRTPFGSAVVLLVRRTVGGWLGVDSPAAGNGRLGWIPRAAVSLDRVDWRIEVTLSRRQVEISEGGRVLKRFTVAIGMPSAPTPIGQFAVTDKLLTHDPSGPYGCCILALSAVAPHAIQGWDGGNRIAIHSTPETWTIGRAASHGCLRLTLAEGRWLLGHVPLGTPTIIRS